MTAADPARALPRRRPRTAYVLCATPRTGSYLLCEALSRTGVAGRPTEHLSGTYQRHYQRAWGTTTYDEYLDRVLAEGTTPNGVFGTKLHRHQLDHVVRQLTGTQHATPPQGLDAVRELLGDPAWIFLRRRDTLAQAVSYTRSMQTEVWWEADYRPAPAAPPSPESARFDLAQIEAYRRRLIRWDRHWESWFTANGIEPLQIAYEDLVDDLPGTVLLVLGRLGLRLPEDYEPGVPRLRRQADDRSADWMARYRALQAARESRTFAPFEGLHAGAPLVVCGCGRSLLDLDRHNERITIGVNDVGRAFTPSYLVLFDNLTRFPEPRRDHIRATRADVVFTNQFLDFNHPFVVRMALHESPEPRLAGRTDIHVLRRPWYSPYLALSIAATMGADPIGLVGVDFADDHFFDHSGPYVADPEVARIDDQFRALEGLLTARRQRVANLSPRSRLRAFPQIALRDFDALPRRGQELDRRTPQRIVVYDAEGGALPGILARSIWAETGDHARFVHGRGDASPMAWPDLDWQQDPGAVEAELHAADVVLAFSAIRAEHRGLLERTPCLDVVGAPALRLGGRPVPTPMPAWSQRFSPQERDGLLTVLVAPGGEEARLTAAVVTAAERARVPVRLVDADESSPSDLEKWRCRADVVVDPAPDAALLWALAGLSAGSVVVRVTGAGAPTATEVTRFASRPAPWVPGERESLDRVLDRVFTAAPRTRAAQGSAGRSWVQDCWSFGPLWRRWWRPAITAGVVRYTRETTHG